MENILVPMEGSRLPKYKLVFNDWLEMVDYAEKTPSLLSDSQRVSRQGTDGWSGCTFEQALDLARNGWHSLEDRVRAISEATFEAVGSAVVRPEPLFDVEGEGLDVGKYVQGEPECWMRYEHEVVPAPGKLPKITFNYSASAGVGTSGIFNKGAAIVSLIEVLEFSGQSVELWCADTSAYTLGQLSLRRYCLYENWVKVKGYGEPLDVGRMLYALAHTSMLRRLSFSIQETLPAEYMKVMNRGGGMHYGAAWPLEKEDWGDLYVDASSTTDAFVNWKSPESTKQWVLSQLRQQGVQFNENTLVEG